MEHKDYTVVFEKLSEYQSQQLSDSNRVAENEEIAELRKIVLEVTELDYNFYTTT
jgi:hypothetical protein